ncbi:MAG TPA: pyridoxal phosphate-dependent aminotransferase [Microscillaceae bacterium]|nr:pyridoxal phosphate-dependent aminotransferase [Microscillaceae bacterium]
MPTPIYLSPPHLSGQELALLQQTLASNWIAPLGQNLDTFEQQVANYCAMPYALAVNSGTAAIHLGLKLLDVQPGDYVICPTLTFAATANPIVYQGATPIFIDSEPQTWNMSPEWLAEALAHCRRANLPLKAVIVVHLYGQPAAMTEITELCRRYEVPILEDAAEALGASYQATKAGAWGDVGVFSFNGNKIITTSAGGMLLVKEEVLRQKALYWATQAKADLPYYHHEAIGYNYRLSNVLAALGIAQMQVLEQRIAARRANFMYYQSALREYSQIQFQEEITHSFSNRWLTCLTFTDKSLPDKIRMALAVSHIEARPIWKPLHLQPVFQHFPYFGEQIAEDLFARGLCLPSGSALSPDELAQIVAIITGQLPQG